MGRPGVPAITHRRIPADFRDTFARLGWQGILAHYRVHRSTLKRWMLDYGEDELRQARRDYLTAEYAKLGRRIPGVQPGRANRYVLGRTLRAFPKDGPGDPRFWDAGLLDARSVARTGIKRRTWGHALAIVEAALARAGEVERPGLTVAAQVLRTAVIAGERVG